MGEPNFVVHNRPGGHSYLAHHRDQLRSTVPLQSPIEVQQQVDAQIRESITSAIFAHEQALFLRDNAVTIQAHAAERAARTAQPIESMLMVAVVAGCAFYFHPETLLLAVGAGNLLSAWSPLAHVSLENGGELAAALIQRYTEHDCSDKIVWYILLSGPTAWSLSWIPIIGGLASMVGRLYTFGVGLFLGNYLWNQQISAWEEHHPANEEEPAPQARAITTIFQVRRLFERVDALIEERVGALREGSPADRLARAIRSWDTSITAGKLLLACGTVGLLSVLYSCPYTFASTTILTAYLCATSEMVDGAFADNPVMRRFPHAGSAIIAAAGLAAVTVGTVFGWGVANGLATAAYWRGPFSFSAYQVLGWAYINSLWSYALTAGAGALIGHQLWSEARLLYQSRRGTPKPDFGAAVGQASVWLAENAARPITGLIWLYSSTPQERQAWVNEIFLGERPGPTPPPPIETQPTPSASTSEQPQWNSAIPPSDMGSLPSCLSQGGSTRWNSAIRPSQMGSSSSPSNQGASTIRRVNRWEQPDSDDE